MGFSQFGNFENSVTVRRPHHLTLQDVSTSVRYWEGSWYTCGCVRRDTKRVLNKLNMSAKSGELIAFVGNSGSGKTSLLNVIAHRHGGTTEGNILLDGNKLTSQLFSSKGAYVIQSDRFLTGLSVRETLVYAVKLAFSGRYTNSEVHKKVEECLHRMGIYHVADDKVGGLIKRGISGGEKRRLSVAMQLLRDPDVLLLDEPTTGLDSFTAHYLVETLANIAHHENKLVIMTIHQPRSDIFRLLDTVGILSAGRMVYYGQRAQLVNHFTHLGHPCPRYANPLDFYIDLASMDYRSETGESQSIQRVDMLCKAYTESSIFTSVVKEVEFLQHGTATEKCEPHRSDMGEKSSRSHLTETGKYENAKQVTSQSRVECGFGCRRALSLWAVNIRRMYVHIFRDRKLVTSRLNNMITFALFLWLYCWRLSTNWRSIQDRIGLIYQVVGVSCAVGCMTAFTNCKWHRESGEGLYNCVHFLGAYYIHILPFQCVGSLGFSVWCYWGVGLHPDAGRFFIFAAVGIIQQHLGELQTVCCLGLMYDPNKARVVANMLITLSMQYASGLIKSADFLIPPLKQLTYINHYKYASEILVANEMAGLQFECPTTLDPNCTVSGDDLLENIYPGVNGRMEQNFGILVSMIIIYWTIAILCFTIKGRKVLN